MFTIYALFALDMLNFSLFLPIFNKYTLSLGGSHSFIGLLGTSTAFISLIWKPVAGNLSDTKGRRKIIQWCIILSFIGNITTYLSSSLYPLFVSRLFCAFGSPMQTLLRASLSDVSTDSAVTNKIGAILSICFMSGALLSGFLSEYSYGFNLIFLIISINLLISFVLANLLPNGKFLLDNEVRTSRSNSFQKMQSIYKSMTFLQWSQYWDLFAIKGLIDLSYGVMQMNLGFVLLYEFNIEGRYVGYIFCLLGVMSVITNLISVKLNATYYKTDKGFLRILHGCILLVLSYFGLGLSSIYSVFLCWFALQAMARTILDATLFDSLNNRVKDGEKGTVVSLFDGVLSLTELISPILSSILTKLYGEKKTLLLCTIPSTIGFFIAYFKKRDDFKLKQT